MRYEDDLNLYAYVGNDAPNRSDPTGMRVFSGTRQVTPGRWVFLPGVPVPVYVPPQNHSYMATNADYIGDPNATIHSWGPENSFESQPLNPGALVKHVGTELNQADQRSWRQSDENTVGIVEIDADDAVADAAADNVVGHPVYQALPDLQPGPGANSNGAEYRAASDADRASGRNDPNAPTPRPANVPGWDDPVVVRRR